MSSLSLFFSFSSFFFFPSYPFLLSPSHAFLLFVLSFSFSSWGDSDPSSLRCAPMPAISTAYVVSLSFFLLFLLFLLPFLSFSPFSFSCFSPFRPFFLLLLLGRFGPIVVAVCSNAGNKYSVCRLSLFFSPFPPFSSSLLILFSFLLLMLFSFSSFLSPSPLGAIRTHRRCGVLQCRQ